MMSESVTLLVQFIEFQLVKINIFLKTITFSGHTRIGSVFEYRHFKDFEPNSYFNNH